MSRIATTFSQLQEKGRKALIPYVTAGFPFADITPALMHGMVEAGADVIELGVPFSDPMADGPVIQKAGEKALSLGIAPEEAARRFASHARALILLVKGNATEAQLGGAASGELTALLLRMTDALIDEIAANLPGPAGAKPPAGLED